MKYEKQVTDCLVPSEIALLEREDVPFEDNQEWRDIILRLCRMNIKYWQDHSSRLESSNKEMVEAITTFFESHDDEKTNVNDLVYLLNKLRKFIPKPK